MNRLDAPFLNSAAIQKEVARLARHGRSLMAIYGTGEEQVVSVEGGRDVRVVPVRSELELRARVPELGDSSPWVFLVPWHHNLVDDLAGRFVGSGQVYRIDRGAQLAALMGASKTDDTVAGLLLGEYLLRQAQKKRYNSSSQVISKNQLYEIWLRQDWSVPTEGGLSSDALVGWAASNGRGGEFLAEMALAPQGLREQLLAHLSEQLSSTARVVWQTWEQRQGLGLLAFAVLCEALAPISDRGVEVWLRSKAKSCAQLDAGVDLNTLPAELARLVRPALAWLKKHDAPRVEQALRVAGELVDDDSIAPHLIHSARLPQAWGLRLSVLSERLEAVAKKPTREALSQAEQAWRELESHEFFLRQEHSYFIETVEMVLRLAAWLTVSVAQPLEPSTSSYGDVETLGRFYAEEGGYIDWARRRARALQSGPIAPGAQAVVLATDGAREALDLRFARALEQWVYAGRPSKNVLPIDSALKRVAVRFLEQEPDRTLLVLLMDGMAWAQAVELLPSLGQEGRRWGPIAWHASAGNRIGEGAYPVMLAALPTITEVSRAAFFAGAMSKKGETLNTGKDAERFAGNPALQSFCEPGVKPRLLLRGDGHTADGALSQEAQHLIAATREQRVVGLVVNAIDASLKGDAQHEHRWDIESIRSLRHIFDAARDAGRHVLLVADHGHVAADRLKNIGPGDGGGARWRLWRGEADALQPGERKFSGAGVHVPRGSDAVVLLEHDGVRYGGAPHAGEHGGAALAEVVAPCLLLGYEDEVRTQQDAALALRGLFVPDWWTRALPTVVIELVRGEPPSRRTAKKPATQNLELPGISPSVEPVPAGDITPVLPSTKAKDALPALWNSPMLKDRKDIDAIMRARTVAAVHFLLQRSCAAPTSAFAAHLGEPEFRVGGLISKLQEILNLDGYEVLRFDRTNRQVFLDKAKLSQQFQITL